jgi:hypothetical protein
MVVLARDIVGLSFLESKRDSIPFVYPAAGPGVVALTDRA